jgi:hypothetical protein
VYVSEKCVAARARTHFLRAEQLNLYVPDELSRITTFNRHDVIDQLVGKRRHRFLTGPRNVSCGNEVRRFAQRAKSMRCQSRFFGCHVKTGTGDEANLQRFDLRRFKRILHTPC